MDRRSFLQVAAASLTGVSLPISAKESPVTSPLKSNSLGLESECNFSEKGSCFDMTSRIFMVKRDGEIAGTAFNFASNAFLTTQTVIGKEGSELELFHATNPKGICYNARIQGIDMRSSLAIIKAIGLLNTGYPLRPSEPGYEPLALSALAPLVSPSPINYECVLDGIQYSDSATPLPQMGKLAINRGDSFLHIMGTYKGNDTVVSFNKVINLPISERGWGISTIMGFPNCKGSPIFQLTKEGLYQFVGIIIGTVQADYQVTLPPDNPFRATSLPQSWAVFAGKSSIDDFVHFYDTRIPNMKG